MTLNATTVVAQKLIRSTSCRNTGTSNNYFRPGASVFVGFCVWVCKISKQEIFSIVTNLITPRSLFSPVFLQSCSVIHESGSDNPFQRYGHSKFSKMAGGWILDLVQPEVDPFDPPSPITVPRTKHGVDRMTRSRDMAVRNFPKCEVGRSVGRSSVLNITLFSCTPLRYVGT